MSNSRHSEAAFEAVIEAHLLQNGYIPIARDGFDRDRAIFPATVLAFIRETQPVEWAKLEALHGHQTGEQVLTDLCKWMDANGSLATLRHGFKCYGRTLHAAFFKAAHELNPELEARYAANRLGLTRQLRFSPQSEKSLDITLSLNGIPIATVELKNPLTGQMVEDAIGQYRRDRDPREPIFEFKRRTLVHFAVDTECVCMTTRLAGDATHFLPFDKGCNGGAGNPHDGRAYRTAHLWEEVLAQDSLLDVLARFVHLQTEEKRDDQGRKVKAEAMIFPRYHQLDAVRLLVQRARCEGVGNNYLIEHSAGSGKSNTIGWLAHRLASLHDAANERVFDSVIVVTDRVVLDQQLQDTIYQFEHKLGVVQKIDEHSRQLAEALENAVPIIITTLQKFPFVSRQLLKMAEEQGVEGTVAQKTEVMVEHFHAVTRHKIGGRAKAMVVTGSRLEAVRYKQSFDRYIQKKQYAIKTLVAFSGEVRDDQLPSESYTEEQMNLGIREKELPEKFATQEYQVLLVVEKWLASQAYQRLQDTTRLPPALRIVAAQPDERYVTCVPLVPLAIAAGEFGDPQNMAAEEHWEWVEVDSTHRLRPGMFVAQIVGHSMEPTIPHRAYGLFRAPVEGTRQGKTVLVQLHDATDPETGARYTLKCYESKKVQDGDSWRHTEITLKPINPEFEPIVLASADEGEVAVVAELVEVLAAMPADGR